MKHLLLPALALSLTACGNNDIVVTSEVGEKIIVERDTIRLNSDSRSSFNEFDDLIEISKRTEKLLCDGTSANLCENERQDIEALKHAQTLNKGPVWRQEWRFLPVYRDRNGNEKVGKEKFVQCYSPSLTTKDKETLNSSLVTKIVTYNGLSLKDSVAKTICNEYPKWEP